MVPNAYDTPSEPRLCSVCRNLDVRKLLLASAAVPVSEETSVWERLHLKTLGLEPHLFFKQHANLASLKQAIAHCDLCRSIWRWYSKTGSPSKVSDQAVKSGLSLEQIYITCTPANELWQKFAQIVAFQKGPDDSTRILASFDPCADRGSVPRDGEKVVLRSIYPYSGDLGCIGLAYCWLMDCLQHHKSCKLSQDFRRALPTRVIDVGLVPNRSDTAPRLVDGAGRSEDYVALSYCWGGESALTLTVGSKERLRQGIPLNDFPATLRDALTVTRTLGIRFLWIDALCIQQDSPEDWAAEAARMRDVYRGAIVTICASSASRASEGMFCHRTPPATICWLPWNEPNQPGKSVFLRQAIEVMDAELRASFINSRRWTLQESLLAPRTLWFGRQQLMFECYEGQINEAGHNMQSTEYYRNKNMISQLACSTLRVQISRLLRFIGVPSVMNVPYYTLRRPLPWNRNPNATAEWFMAWTYPIYTQGRLQSQSGRSFTVYHQWREIVRRYTERNLTQQEDMLPALAGLAEHFGKVTGDQYVAGLWRGDLVRCLNWYRSCPYIEYGNHHPANTARHGAYIAPSWSWASILGSATSFAPHYNGSESGYLIQNVAKVVDVSVQLATADLYGRLLSGRLILHAPFLEVLSPQVRIHANAKYPALQEYIWQDVASDLGDVAHTFNQQHVDCGGQEFGLVQTCTTRQANIDNPICTLEVLLVESTGDESFRRVAHLTVQLSGRLVGSTENPFRDMEDEIKNAIWTKKTITLL